MKGRIHSTESCGTVDGPGIRFVVFMQGCPLRCMYCHNPDTWNPAGGTEVTVDDIMQELDGYVPYMRFSGGGITVTGGEPLLQAAFVRALFERCKQKDIHTALDTSGICYNKNGSNLSAINELLDVTDLVLLDIKHIDEEKHRNLTQTSNRNILDFARHLAERRIPVWIRHVLVPSYTDDPNDLQMLANFIQTLPNVQKVEVLPYHCMGVYKWKTLGFDYPLDDVKPPSEEAILKAKDVLERSVF